MPRLFVMKFDYYSKRYLLLLLSSCCRKTLWTKVMEKINLTERAEELYLKVDAFLYLLSFSQNMTQTTGHDRTVRMYDSKPSERAK